MLIDTHCHLTFDAFAHDLDGVLQRAMEADVTRMVTIATQPRDAYLAADRLGTRANVFFAAGIHPHEAARADRDMLDALAAIHHGRELAGINDRLVAVGETGLDFHYDFATPQQQETVFRFQLELACAVGRPVVIHAREAEARVCDILAEYPALSDRVVFHCFSGSAEVATRILEMGLWLSFTGVVTFRNAEALRQVARSAPADRIMIETDAPYMTPEPHRKVRPNEPRFVSEIAAQLAALRGVSLEEFARQTTRNAERFFKLPKETT